MNLTGFLVVSIGFSSFGSTPPKQSSQKGFFTLTTKLAQFELLVNPEAGKRSGVLLDGLGLNQPRVSYYLYFLRLTTVLS